MSHNQSRIVSGESASNRLKNRVAVFQQLVNSARSYMMFLPHNVLQSIIQIRLDVTSSFRKRLVSTNESSETNFRLFHVATKTGNEDERRREKDTIVPSTVFVLLL